LSAPDLQVLPRLPRDAEGPVFAEPWQAQAFALAVRLSAEGLFSWPDWAAALSRELLSDPDDDGSRYYLHWVAALEALVTERGLLTSGDLAARKHAWAEAYEHTPHGQPVALSSH
jgi:nitrile hydratase accessory protein